ncbi:hypothetical protein VKT23_008144 [Stygiomarasmius scandens]|uniref:Uncharacterized protein n=1 Tax=Marasmiellus scandens TaxID=2682957 RepID=A0ABR1JHE0_9AGAR
MKQFILCLFYIPYLLIISATGFAISAPSTVQIGDSVQANYSSQFPPESSNQPDYVIVIAQKNQNGLYPQNNIGTTFIARGNKIDKATGSVNFIINEEGTFAVQMYEESVGQFGFLLYNLTILQRDTLFGQSGDIIATASSTASESLSVTSAPNPASPSSQSVSRLTIILASVLGGLLVIIALPLLIILRRQKRLRRSVVSVTTEREQPPDSEKAMTIHPFPYDASPLHMAMQKVDKSNSQAIIVNS